MGVLDQYGLYSQPVVLVIQIVTCSAALHNLVIWLFHWTYTCSLPDINKIQRLSVWALFITTIATFCFSAAPYLASYQGLHWTIVSCQWLAFFTRWCYLLSKTVGLYIVYIERLFHIFKDMHSFKKWQMTALRSYIVFATILGTTLMVISRGFFVKMPQDNFCIFNTEHSKWHKVLIFAALVLDFGFCNLIICMYCRRLLVYMTRLNMRMLHDAPDPNTTHQNQDADKMYYKMMVKSTVLTFVASLSSQIYLLLGFIMGRPVLWASLDSMINSWCLLLIFDLYDDLFNLYPICCGLCHRVLSYQCIVCCSCHFCCRVDIGIEIGMADVVGGVNRVNDVHSRNVELQVATTQRDMTILAGAPNNEATRESNSATGNTLSSEQTNGGQMTDF